MIHLILIMIDMMGACIVWLLKGRRTSYDDELEHELGNVIASFFVMIGFLGFVIYLNN